MPKCCLVYSFRSGRLSGNDRFSVPGVIVLIRERAKFRSPFLAAAPGNEVPAAHIVHEMERMNGSVGGSVGVGRMIDNVQGIPANRASTDCRKISRSTWEYSIFFTEILALSRSRHGWIYLRSSSVSGQSNGRAGPSRPDRDGRSQSDRQAQSQDIDSLIHREGSS